MTPSFWKTALAGGVCLAVLQGSATAQGQQASTAGGAVSAQPAPAPPAAASQDDPIATLVQAVSLPAFEPLSAADAQSLRQGLIAAKRGDTAGARAAQSAMTHPLARKILLWAMIDATPDRLSFLELDQARRDLWNWPRQNGRRAAAEKMLEVSGLGPSQVVAWFEGEKPRTAEGAMALAAAHQQLGRAEEARQVVRRAWREDLFEADPQRRMLARFGGYLTVEDHVARADMLLFGPQGPAARDMIALLPADHQAAAEARIALRAGRKDADALLARTPAHLARQPGLTFERARSLRQRGQHAQALTLLEHFPAAPPHSDGASRVWLERRILVNAAIQAGDYRAAYRAVDAHGLPPGADAADAEFIAGWMALTRLNDPALADRHFANLERIGSSPITRSRALYWRGRAKEAMRDAAGAQAHYLAAAEYPTAFYGQLAAEKAGLKEIVIGADPEPTAADRARFEGRELIQAAKLLHQAGERDLYRMFVLAADDTLPNTEEHVLLVDMARGNGDQDLSMRVVRAAAQRGFILPERGYPVRSTPAIGSAEPALVLGITRQESGFDPLVRSGVGARGMMQLMPATAQAVARRTGVQYAPAMLDDPEYNMRLGTTFLGQMVDQFSGSYIMASAAYNAGPGRLPQWTAFCGDPRTASGDPVDFIECIPISETRNYVMRVIEGMQVYRARLNGGRAPATLHADLKRGAYGTTFQVADNSLDAPAAASAGPPAPPRVTASTPVPNPPEPARGR